MRFQSIRNRIAVAYVVLIALAMAGVAWYVVAFVRNTNLTETRERLAAQATLISYATRPMFLMSGVRSTGELAERYASLMGVRVTFIDADGAILADSEADAGDMLNHLQRPEIRQARDSGVGSAIRYSNTVQYDALYVAVPVLAPTGPAGYVRVAVPLRAIDSNVAALRRRILGATGVVLVIAALLGIAIAERTARPVRELTEVVRRVADGDLSARLVSRSRDEVGTLTRDFGVMAERLRTTIEDLRHERSESAAILERMADGIVIVDPHGLVHLINPAAQRFLATTFEEAAGRSLPQVAREEQIVELVRASLREGRPQSGLVEIPRRDLLLNVIAAPLPSEALEGSSMLVLQDLSEVRRLETVRRDFGSDVSHELRTPLASLRALVDTLRGGAIDDPPAAARFLERMDTEIDDLTQMVEELLTLSRIESGQAPVRLAPMPVADLIAPVLDRLTPQVERGRLSLSVSLPEDMPRVLADDDQVSQALTNIVQNAIKFTPDGGSIVVSARPEGDQVVISVRDTGIGIAPDVLPRVFERFFKADQSRASHGTGLGLAIAKHVVQAHGGRIWAESVQGQGSTFSFTLPTEPATRT